MSGVFFTDVDLTVLEGILERPKILRQSELQR